MVRTSHAVIAQSFTKDAQSSTKKLDELNKNVRLNITDNE